MQGSRCSLQYMHTGRSSTVLLLVLLANSGRTYLASHLVVWLLLCVVLVAAALVGLSLYLGYTSYWYLH